MFEKLCKNMTSTRAAIWEKTHSKGKSHYVWYHGVLGWGLPMFVFMTAIDFYRHQNLHSLILTLIIGAVIWPIGGYWFGASMWAANEKAYKKCAEQKSTIQT